MRMPFFPCPTDGRACADASVEILTKVFGSAVHKLATGQAMDGVSAAGNSLASMMAIFNSGIMTLAGLMVSAVVAGSVMNTANDGEVMGKNWSTPNTIMRVVFGGGLLLPTAAGYSVIQMLVLTITLWAVGLANLVYEKGVEVGILSGDTAVTSAQMGIADKTVNASYALADLRTFAEGVTRSMYCAHVANATFLMASGQKPAIQTAAKPDAVIDEPGRTSKEYWFADRNPSTNLVGGRPVCGAVTLYDYKADSLVVPDSETASLQGLRFAIYKAKSDAMMAMVPAIQRWVSTWPSSIYQEGHGGIESTLLNEIVRDAEDTVLSNLANGVQSNAALQKIMTAYVKSITDKGWLFAGGFYQKMGDVRGAVTRMMVEPVANASAPNLNGLPASEQSREVIASVDALPGIVMSRAMQNRTTVSPADIGSIIQSGLSTEGGSVDAVSAKAEGVFSAWINNSMQGIMATLLGTSGNVDAIARIKATGDIFAMMAATGLIADKAIYTGISATRTIAATGGSIRIFGSGVNLEPAVKSVLDWASHVILKPLASVISMLDTLAFYFGVFLPTLPYTIFLVAAVGFLLQVLQTIVAAPLWAMMHMTPERTFIGSQTQGYLLLVGLFVRPALMVVGLFAAFCLINPVLDGVTAAFFAMRRAVNADSYWLVQFLQLKNWLIVYSFLLAPLMFMVFGLSQTLPDAVLQWLNIGTSNLGHTQATSEMRAQTEKYGPSPSLSSPGLRQLPLQPTGRRATPDALPASDRGDGGKAESGALLSANPQGVTPSIDKSNQKEP